MLSQVLSALAFALVTYSPSFGQQQLHLQDQIWGHLRVAIIDETTGRAVPARCYLTDQTSKDWVPSGALSYVKPPERDFIASGNFQIELPTGTYRLRVERGTEYRPEKREIEIHAGEIRHEKIVLRRWINMKARGWYSGDLHNHRNWEEMPQILLSEDLNLAPTLTKWVWDDRTISIVPVQQREERAIRTVDATHVYSIVDTEIERLRHGPGAINLIGLKSSVEFRGYDLSPPNREFTELAHAQGGYVDAEKITWRDSAALVALGQVDFVGIVYNSFSPHGVEMGWGVGPNDNPLYATPAGAPLWAMDLYYKFLNCGFKLPVSAGTASGVKPTPLGYDRVYAHLPGRFSYAEWFRALKAGRSFATNGPMLILTVDGHEPGDTIEVTEKHGRKLTIHAEAISVNELQRLEVIWKGEIIEAVPTSGNLDRLTVDVEHEVHGTGWVVARAFEKPTVTVRFAHTSPVYVRVENDRGIVPNDAEYFAAWMDKEIRFYENLRGFRTEADRKAMLNFFGQARQVYTQLVSYK